LRDLDPATGGERTGVAVEPGVTAVLRDEDTVVGWKDGFIAVDRGSTGALRSAPLLAGTPSSAVTTLAAGPASTLVAGFADGTVGVWARASHRKLYEARLTGPVDHALIGADRVVAVSALGETVTIDLSVLRAEYCALLREIWEETPVVWSEAGPVVRSPPASHACAEDQ
jgi:hypothetical protein